MDGSHDHLITRDEKNYDQMKTLDRDLPVRVRQGFAVRGHSGRREAVLDLAIRSELVDFVALLLLRTFWMSGVAVATPWKLSAFPSRPTLSQASADTL